MFKERLLRLLWIFFDKFGLIFLSLISFYIFAKVLTPEELGLGVLVLAIVEIVGGIYTSMLEDPFVRQKTISVNQDATLFWSCAILSLMSMVLVMLGTFLYTDDALIHGLMAFALLKLPLLLGSRVYVAHLRRDGNFKALALRGLLGKFVGGIAGISIALAGFGVWAIIVQSVVMELVAIIILINAGRIKLPLYIDTKFFKSLVIQGMPITLKAMSGELMSRGCIFLIALVAGSGAVGVFNFAQRLVSLPRDAITHGLFSYALPVFARRQDNHVKLGRFYCLATQFTSFLLVPAFMGLSLIAEDAIMLIFGAKWQAAIPVLQLLAIIATLSSLLIYAGGVLVAVQKTNLTLKSDFMATGVSLIAVYFLAFEYGALAGGIALGIRFIIVTPIMMLAIKLAIGLTVTKQVKSVYRSLLAAIGMWTSILVFDYFFSISGIMHLILVIAIGIISYSFFYTLIHLKWPRDLKDFLANS